jgi:hypothetical protein
MILKTKDYDQFKFRPDNREKIDLPHVERLAESIKSRNLLEFRPILVNQKMEIIDGQNRLLAAKKLQVDIYYQIEASLDAKDILLMNVVKKWTMGDYLNFHIHQGNQNYIKLKKFIKRHNINIKIAFNICSGAAKTAFNDFKKGGFLFSENELEADLSVCWETIDYIKKMNGFSSYTASAKFWQAFFRLLKHKDFNIDKWRANMKSMVSEFSPRARLKDYIRMFQGIYNWHNTTKITLDEEVVE